MDIQKLIKLADRLDAKGLHSLADQIEGLIADQVMSDVIEENQHPIDQLIEIADSLDKKGLTALADKMDRIIEIEAFEHQSAIDTILTIYKKKHEVRSGFKGFCKKAQWDEEENIFWSEEGSEDITPQQILHDILFGLEEQIREGDTSPQWVFDNIDQWWKNACFSWEEGVRSGLIQEIEDQGFAAEEYARAKIEGRVEEMREMLRSIEPQAKRMAIKQIRNLLIGQIEKTESDQTGYYEPGTISEETTSTPSVEDLNKMFRFEKLRGFCKTATKKTSSIRKNNLPEDQRCPFGLSIPVACMNVGSTIHNMIADPRSFKDNRTIYNSGKEGKTCPFAAEILKKQRGVDCTHGTSMEGKQTLHEFHSSPFYPKLWESVGYPDISPAYNMFHGDFGFAGNM